MAALYSREKTGKGEMVSSSLFQTGIFAATGLVQSAYYYPDFIQTNRENPVNPLLNSYLCKDDEWLLLSCMDYEQFGLQYLKVLGLHELAEDPELHSLPGLMIHRDKVMKAIEQAVRQKTRKEWGALFFESGLSYEVVQHFRELFDDEQAWANHYLRKITYPSGNEAVISTSPVTLKSMGMPEFNNAPRIGEHTVEVLKEMGYTKEQIQTMRDSGVVGY